MTRPVRDPWKLSCVHASAAIIILHESTSIHTASESLSKITSLLLSLTSVAQRD